MKLTAFSAARRQGNTEVFLKEALMGAEELGVEVEFIRLNDFELHNCTSCGQPSCLMSRQGIDKCIYKDDAEFLINKFLDSDGVLFGASVYSVTPNSLFFTLRDRMFGPKMDTAGAKNRPVMPAWLDGRIKNRPVGLISVGGALSAHWTSLSLPCMYMANFSAQSETVDYMNVTGVASQGAAALREDLLARARLLGRHVAEAMLTGDHSWRGDEEGTCPSCHLNLVQMTPGTNEIVCPVCGISGRLEMQDGVVKAVWPDDPEHRQENRFTFSGKQFHVDEIETCLKALMPHMDEIPAKMQKYKDYSACEVKSPIREARKEELRQKYAKKE